MEGEAHVKGFLLSYMGMNSYYITMPEYEMNKGFSDFYLIPNLPQLPDMPYSYAIEVTQKMQKWRSCWKMQEYSWRNM